jgi:hypothetical protein
VTISVRKATPVLALFVAMATPLTTQAGHGVRHGGFVVVQPPKYFKPTKITPENPAVVQARQQHLAKLKGDLEAIRPAAAPTKEQAAALYQSLMSVVDGSNKPAPAAVQKLATDLTAMLAHRGTKTAIDTQKLAQCLKVVMNSAYVMTLDSHMATRTSQDLLKASGSPEPDTQAIVGDLKTIATQASAAGRPGMIR